MGLVWVYLIWTILNDLFSVRALTVEWHSMSCRSNVTYIYILVMNWLTICHWKHHIIYFRKLAWNVMQYEIDQWDRKKTKRWWYIHVCLGPDCDDDDDDFHILVNDPFDGYCVSRCRRVSIVTSTKNKGASLTLNNNLTFAFIIWTNCLSQCFIVHYRTVPLYNASIT